MLPEPIAQALRDAARGARVGGPIDAAMLDAAAAEGMTGLLARAAEDESRELRIVASAIEARSLYLAAELARIAGAFRDASLRVLALKGAITSQQLYGHPGLRVFGDLDIIVARDDADRGEALLIALGYREQEPMTPAQRATKLRFHNGSSFVNDQRGTVADFHWRFGHVQFPLALSFDDAWQRRIDVDVAGHALPALGWSDLVVFTCSHAAKHFWQRMEMLAQIAALSRAREIDWAEADRIAVEARSAAPVGLSFLIANDVLGSDLPPIPGCLAVARRRFARMTARLARPHESDPRGRDLFLILDRRRDVAVAAAAAIFVPTYADWSAARMPSALYWLVRPLRLALARMSRLT